MQLSNGLNNQNNDSFQQQIFNMIQSLSGEKNLLAIPREIIRFTGDLESGVFLAQLIYWTDKGSRKDGFIYKTIREWQDEVFISEYSLRKIRKNLESMGILETKLKKANGNPTIHYKINQKAFIDQFLRFQSKETSITNKEDCVSEDSLTYTTPQTTDIKYNNYNGTRSVDARTSEVKEYVRRSASTIAYYFNAYLEYKGYEHSALKKKQIERVSEVISGFMSEFSIDEGNMETMIDQHFLRNHLETDHNINHFAMRGILENLYYEAGLK